MQIRRGAAVAGQVGRVPAELRAGERVHVALRRVQKFFPEAALLIEATQVLTVEFGRQAVGAGGVGGARRIDKAPLGWLARAGITTLGVGIALT